MFLICWISRIIVNTAAVGEFMFALLLHGSIFDKIIHKMINMQDVNLIQSVQEVTMTKRGRFFVGF